MPPWRAVAVACCTTAAALTAPVLSRHRRHARRDAVGEAWAESVKEEFADGSRSDVKDDLNAAAKVRDALEALKPELIRAWDDDDAVLVEGINAFDGWFGLKELEAACDQGEVREAGRGVLGAGGAWQMARVGVKDEPITYDDVKGVLDASQTVVLNSLDATCSRVAALSLASIDAFGLPVCTNAYATGAGAATSAPPHTDKQRVLVFQCFGRKHWRVWRPPDPSKRPETDPLARGKATKRSDDAAALSPRRRRAYEMDCGWRLEDQERMGQLARALVERRTPLAGALARADQQDEEVKVEKKAEAKRWR